MSRTRTPARGPVASRASLPALAKSLLPRLSSGMTPRVMSDYNDAKKGEKPRAQGRMSGLDFELAEEHRMLKDLVARFVRDELTPLEGKVLEREATGGGLGLGEDDNK